MKIAILHQNISNQQAMTAGIALAGQKLASVGINTVIDYYPTSRKFSTVKYSNDANKLGVAINPNEILSEVRGQYDVACLLFDESKYAPQPTNPAHHGMNVNGCSPIQIPLGWWMDQTREPDEYFPEVLAQFFVHELAHYVCYVNGKPDTVHDQFKHTEWQNKQPIDYYLSIVKDLKLPKEKPMNKYKYFSQKEVEKWKLVPEMWLLLDKMREECGFPFVINSGLRTKAENEALKDSVSDSAHLSGKAVDITITDSAKRLKFVQVALKNGINRIGIGKNFCHIDNDLTKPSSVMWTYY